MNIHFSDKSTVPVHLYNNSVAEYYTRVYKKLQFVPLHFAEHDNPYSKLNSDPLTTIKKLVLVGTNLNVDVDPAQCLNQPYLNILHKIYEKNYKPKSNWLEFHELIHLVESQNRKTPLHGATSMHIDYREKSGPLITKFNTEWKSLFTTKVSEGDVYVQWAELSKDPYNYWKDKEPPNDINRLCELSKPWLSLKPKLFVSLTDFDFMSNKDITGFNEWWQEVKQPWCTYWEIDDWTLKDIESCIVIGKVPIDHINLIRQNLQSNVIPVKVTP